VSTLTGLLLSPRLAAVQGGGPVPLALGAQLVISLGAGIYEELLFRVLLVWAFTALGGALGLKRAGAVALAVVLSALVFSAFHYVGPLGDTLTLSSFTFRAIAGLLLSALYVARGFGITAWTHALYDVGLALVA
jgi:TRAP-type C4-dicarboxylate transport system permease small subunit